MINALLTGIMNLIIKLVTVILMPIDYIITTTLPDISQGLTNIASMFKYVGQYIGFVLDTVAIPSSAINLLIVYYTFKLTVPLMISTVKTAIKWYDKLKP